MSNSPKDTGGPIVKTGPTAGKNRSRNKDGAWRKKRIDSGKSKEPKESKGLCFLTTAACTYKGLPDNCHELEILRHFRDTYLSNSTEGQMMIKYYYSLSSEITYQLEPDDLEFIWTCVTDCVAKLETQQYEEVIYKYKNMVEMVCLRISKRLA